MLPKFCAIVQPADSPKLLWMPKKDCSLPPFDNWRMRGFLRIARALDRLGDFCSFLGGTAGKIRVETDRIPAQTGWRATQPSRPNDQTPPPALLSDPESL
jgi:hypothetical protein